MSTVLGVAAGAALAFTAPWIAIGAAVLVAADGLADAFFGKSVTGMFLGGHSAAWWLSYWAAKTLGGLEPPQDDRASFNLRRGAQQPPGQQIPGQEPGRAAIQRQPLPEPSPTS